MKTFREYLESLDACKSAVMWAGDKTIEQVVAECHRGDWLLWLGQKCGVELQPLILAKGHCANTVRRLMTDERSLKAVDMAIAFGEGRATADELNAAADAAYAASRAAADAAYAAAAADAAYAASRAAADAAYAAAAADAAYAAAAANAAAYAAAVDNQQQTVDICRKHIGDLIIKKVNQQLNPTNP